MIDERLVLAGSNDDYYGVLFASNSASDWSRLELIEVAPDSASGNHAEFNVGQRGVASLYNFQNQQSTFSTDLSDWWSIPSLPDVPRRPRE